MWANFINSTGKNKQIAILLYAILQFITLFWRWTHLFLNLKYSNVQKKNFHSQQSYCFCFHRYHNRMELYVLAQSSCLPSFQQIVIKNLFIYPRTRMSIVVAECVQQPTLKRFCLFYTLKCVLHILMKLSGRR